MTSEVASATTEVTSATTEVASATTVDANTFTYSFNIIYAETKEHGIGYEGRLPWQGVAELSAAAKIDTKVFRDLTTGAAVIMGLTTALSLPKGYLPSRDNYILTSKYDSTRAIEAADLTRFGANASQTVALLAAIESGTVRFAASIGELDTLVGIFGKGVNQPIFVIGGEVVYTQFKKFPTLNNIYVTVLWSEEVLPADTYFTVITSNMFYSNYCRCGSNLRFGLYTKNKDMDEDVAHYKAIIDKHMPTM